MASLSRACRRLFNNTQSVVTAHRCLSGATHVPTHRLSSLAFIAGSVAAVAVSAGGLSYLNIEKISTISAVCPTLQAAEATPAAPAKMERTFIMIKPDGVARGLIADIIKRFEQRGYKLVAMKMMTPDKELLSKHYEDLKTKPFFNGLVTHIASGPVVAMVWEGKKAVSQGRSMLGETDPLKSLPGSIRGDFSIDMGRNIIHGSDSVESATKEIELWFNAAELQQWKLPGEGQIYE